MKQKKNDNIYNHFLENGDSPSKTTNKQPNIQQTFEKEAKKIEAIYNQGII